MRLLGWALSHTMGVLLERGNSAQRHTPGEDSVETGVPGPTWTGAGGRPGTEGTPPDGPWGLGMQPPERRAQVPDVQII